MQRALPIAKIAQLVVVMVFLVGSTAIVRQAHNKAYDDLPSFYWATQLAFNQSLSAYQPLHFRQLGETLDRKIYPFLYPPPSLLVFSPFLAGSYEQVKAVFTLCNLLLWWLLTWAMYSLYCVYTGHKKHLLASLLIPLWSLGFMPIADTFRTGQVNLIVLACLAPLFFQPLKHRWQLLSGVLFAVAIMLKVYLVLGLLVLMMTKQTKILAVTLATLVLLGLASLLLLPWQLWLDWLALSHASGSYGNQLPQVITVPWNQSINGFFIRQFLDKQILHGGTHWHWLIYSCSGAVLAATLYIVSQAIKRCAYGASAALALMVLAATLIAPLTWLHHYVFAVPAMICCFALLSTQAPSRYKNIMTAAVLMAAILISFPALASMAFPALSAWQMADKSITVVGNLVVSAQLLAGLVFCGLFSTLILRRQDCDHRQDADGVTIGTISPF